MNYEYSYINSRDRKIKIAEAEALKYRMLHDNFAPEWNSGEEPFGVMIFTDDPGPGPSPPEPHYSSHFGVVVAIDMALERPVRVECDLQGTAAIHDCYVTEWIKDYYVEGHKLAVGDTVIVNFIENDILKPVVYEKMHVSWAS